MTSFKSPKLFSIEYGISPLSLEKEGLIDPFLNVDTQLFIDPVLLEKSENTIIANEGYSTFCNHFQNFIRLLKLSKNEGDVAWKAAEKLLDLDEPPATGLGCGGKSR